jgi:hypothetical protein
MFLFYSLTLLLFVYVAPALALYPKLILSSRTVVAIPFVSIAVVGVAQTAFARVGIYTRPAVITFSTLLLAIAVVRLARLLRNHDPLKLHWPASHRLLLLVSLLLGSYWAAELGTKGFDTHDEIYSWNLWAIQHYLGQEIDFYYTQSPYPQLFSILISYCYKLLGNIELQLPVKALFALFPIALWSAIAVVPKEATFANAIRSIVTMLLLAGIIGRYFGTGLADPLMASSLVVAIFLFIQYSEESDRRELLVLSLVCAAVALYTKQAALIWALFSLPVITLIATAKRRLPPAALLGAVVLLALGLAWVFGPGSGFESNQGVITRSQQGRGPIQQLIFTTQRQFFDQPLVAMFLAAGMISVVRARSHRDILLFFLLPALFAWLLYGAYSLRLGIHVVAVSALLLAATNYPLPALLGGGLLTGSERFIRRHALALSCLTLLLFGSTSLYHVSKKVGKIDENFSLYVSGKNTLTKYFGKDADFVFNELYDKPDLLLWAPSNYIYGIFYGHTPVMRPAYPNGTEYGLPALLDEIKRQRPDYLFESGPEVSFGPGSERLRELAEERCSELFVKCATPPNYFGYTLYRLRNDDALITRCGETLK